MKWAAVELAPLEGAVQDGEGVAGGGRGVIVVDGDVLVDPVAKQELALELVGLPRHHLIQAVAAGEQLDARGAVVFEGGEESRCCGRRGSRPSR